MGPSDVDIILLVNIDDDVVGIVREDTLSITTKATNNIRKADKKDNGIAIVIGCHKRRKERSNIVLEENKVYSTNGFGILSFPSPSY